MRRLPLIVVGLLALALALRVGIVIWQWDMAPQSDAADYERHAISIADGRGFPDTVLAEPGSPTALRPPAYPYVLGAVYAVTGTHAAAGRLLGAVAGVLTVLLVFLIADRVWGRRVGVVACALAAVAPPLVTMNGSLVSEQLFLPAMLALVLLLLWLRDRPEGVPLWGAALVGALCGLCALTRVVGAAFALIAMLALWGGPPRLRLASVAAPVAVLAGALLVVLPWTVRNTVEFDRFTPLSTQEGFNLYGTYNGVSADAKDNPTLFRLPLQLPRAGPLFHRRGIDEADINSRLGGSARDYAMDHPLYPLRVAAHGTVRVLHLTARHPNAIVDYRQTGVPHRLWGLTEWWVRLSVVLALLGVVALASGRARAAPAWLWAIPLWLLLSILFIHALPRYRLPIDPFLIMLGAVGLVAAWNGFAERLRGARPVPAPAEQVGPIKQ